MIIGCIRINNMTFYTYNGVFPEEQKLGQKIEIDAELGYPIEERVHHDQLDETVSYADVYETIKEFVANHHYRLIESLANQLLHQITSAYPRLTKVTLRVRKYGVPMAGVYDNVEIEVTGRPQDDH